MSSPLAQTSNYAIRAMLVPGMPRANTIFNAPSKIHLKNITKLQSKIGMGSPLGAANYIFLHRGATSQKRLGNTG